MTKEEKRNLKELRALTRSIKRRTRYIKKMKKKDNKARNKKHFLNISIIKM